MLHLFCAVLMIFTDPRRSARKSPGCHLAVFAYEGPELLAGACSGPGFDQRFKGERLELVCLHINLEPRKKKIRPQSPSFASLFPTLATQALPARHELAA